MILKDQVVIIAGGCGLIGRAFVEAILEEGGISIMADINQKKGKALSREMQQKYGPDKSKFIFLDIIDKESITQMINESLNIYGHIDTFVNTSFPRSKLSGHLVEDMTYEKFCDDLNLQLGGYFLCSQQMALLFKQQGYGHVINISSIQGHSTPKFETYEGVSVNGKPMTSSIQYTCVKSALNAMTRYLAKYYKGTQIRFNCISPGGIFDNQPKKFIDSYRKFCSRKGMLDPQDLTGALVFLASKQSEFLNGQNIIVDDGWSL